MERPSFALLYDKLKSKSSIYYGPIRTQGSTSDSNSVKIPSPTGTKPKATGTSMPRTPNKHRRTLVVDSRSEEVFTRDMLDYSREDYNLSTRASTEKLPTSSSETSLVSAPGINASMKDDLTRSDKIRKSIRKIMNVKTKRKGSKLNGQKDDRHPPGPVYGN